MKKISIITKRAADKMLVESLFQPVNGATLTRMRYDMGKYKPGSYIGREVDCSENVRAIFPEARRDSDGPYVALFCLTSRP